MNRRMERADRLMAKLNEAGLDAYFVSRIENVRYISGYTSYDSYLMLAGDKRFFITDARYTEQALEECPGWEVVEWRDPYGTVAECAAALAMKSGAGVLGFEENALPAGVYLKLADSFKGRLSPSDGIIEEMRSHKSDEEIQCLRNACDITVRAFERILNDIRPGVTEKELAANLSRYMVLEGADTMPYGHILISGARTSLLHGIPSEKAVAYGEFVLMDFGCQFHGYMSDMTRTVIVGKPTEKQKEVYRLEQKMVADTEDYIKPGRPVKGAYEVSTKAIEGTGYYQWHYKGIGHGVGLFVHEQPFIGPKSEAVFTENTVLTVEPGIYIPGWGGVRIEDTVLIREDGVENLTPAEKELLIL